MSYKPKRAEDQESKWEADVGWLFTEFEPFEPNPKFTFTGRKMPSKDTWPIQELRNGPPIGDIPKVIQDLMNSTWKVAEPAAATRQGSMSIGTRGNAANQASAADTYHPQVRPTRENIPVVFGSATPLASDWDTFDGLDRINAVTFRGDTRPPISVIQGAKGFFPPNTRTDRYYLEKNIYEAFAEYVNRRYQRALTQTDFLRAVDATAPGVDDKRLLVDYLMWRQVCEHEAAHMGRMVSNEVLKGYISTSRAIDSSISFGTAYNSKPGWLYVTLVHGGFVVPWGKAALWGSEEAEIAQWGPVPADRIVGFRHLQRFAPDGPIFMRRSFRKGESKAFEYIFNVMSGMLPNQM